MNHRSSHHFNLAIVGSGFGGSLLAMVARRLGHSVVLLESGRHPRFAIGESSTPLANLLLEELATRYDLPRLLPLTKWGSWQREYPQIACGLKRGFTFCHHRFGHTFEADVDRQNQLLVAASPHEGIADTHWYRPDFDHFLVHEAQQLGSKYFDHTRLNDVSWHNEKIVLRGLRHNEPICIEADFVVDASGPRGFLHRALQLPELPFEHMPPTQALFTHFSGVREFGDTLIASTSHPAPELPPYPIDDAAVHHVFDGGWIWVLRFNNGITSAGVAARDDIANELGLSEGAPAWERLMQKLPSVRQQFSAAQPLLEFKHASRLSFRSGTISGTQWALLPSAAGFVDPLFSTGFPLTLLGITRLAKMMEQPLNSARFAQHLGEYATFTQNELGATERLVAALYANMHDFPMFTRLSLLYFAAASFTETARRLGKPELAGAFLMHTQARFGPQAKACLEQALQPLDATQRRQLCEQIEQTVAAFDVAGLSKKNLRNWYPVDAADLFENAAKLNASHTEIEQLLHRAGFCTSG
ncbi:MAG: tetracycline 7-halogenase / O2-dependent halogenase [Abditibacteriota bacterium]|nr:tetracycline 7-halogenase / O2-dependent halogenase [Abditibacteriota bacterium]